MSEEIKGLPVPGYKPTQSVAAVELVTQFKFQEERLLRQLDQLAEGDVAEKRWLAIGRTHLEEAFMFINRSIFKPGRVILPEDEELDAVELGAAARRVGPEGEY